MSEPLQELLEKTVEVGDVNGKSWHGKLVEVKGVWLKLDTRDGAVYINKAHVTYIRTLSRILVDPYKWLAPSSSSGEKGKSKNKNKK